MRKVIFTLTALALLLSCNMNPSKESRLQKLETELLLTTEKVHELEKKIDSLAAFNSDFKTQMLQQASN